MNVVDSLDFDKNISKLYFHRKSIDSIPYFQTKDVKKSNYKQ